MNSGRKANTAYWPTPSNSATRLVVQTVGIRIMCMSISGWVERDSTMTQITPRAAATSRSAITLLDPQPQVGASLIARISAVSQPDKRNTPDQLMRPGWRTSDSGMTRWAASAAPASTIMGIQKSQW